MGKQIGNVSAIKYKYLGLSGDKSQGQIAYTKIMYDWIAITILHQSHISIYGNCGKEKSLSPKSAGEQSKNGVTTVTNICDMPDPRGQIPNTSKGMTKRQTLALLTHIESPVCCTL